MISPTVSFLDIFIRRTARCVLQVCYRLYSFTLIWTSEASEFRCLFLRVNKLVWIIVFIWSAATDLTAQHQRSCRRNVAKSTVWMPNFHDNLEEFCFLAVFGHWKWSCNLILRKLSAKPGWSYWNFLSFNIVRVVDFTYGKFSWYVRQTVKIHFNPSFTNLFS